ncbi:MAG: MoaD/ThiS family protein [Gammaproteobacteria bacterium]|jgi:molybdopterin converting factor small subunit|nr:MoaD/ThiS family protein [Gammaproteobacteria bacterium]MCP4879449.1 MoaD/ThiS family protein [Gammaproteobacteria bacterium]MDP6165419.1 MoaD/ThiS family protein [Gammaproteobacteria bacterium]
MAKIQIFGSLRDLFSGHDVVELDVSNLRQLLIKLPQLYPECAPEIAEGVSVSIDGKIINDAWFTPIRPDSEVVVLPRIVGG